MHPKRFQVVACGRRFGKTEIGKIIAFKSAVEKGQIVWWITPTYKMSTPVWKTMLDMLKPLSTWVSAQERRIFLPNNGELTVWAGESSDSIRGGQADVIIVDEAAVLPNSEAWYKVLQPALMDREGRAYFFSTPRGMNWFYDLYMLGKQDNTDYKSWKFSSYYNPYIKNSEIDKHRKTTPERFFRQEYLAEFIDDAGEVFRGVNKVAILPFLRPYKGNFVMGIDWGRKLDYTVATIIDIDRMKQVDMIRFSKIDWQFQKEQVKKMYDSWQPKQVIAEENSMGDIIISDFMQEYGINMTPYYMTNKSKNVVIDNLALGIEKKEIELLNDASQMRELQSYNGKRTSFGNMTYSAPSGMHDDTVIALALAYYAATNSTSTFGGAMPRFKGWVA